MKRFIKASGRHRKIEGWPLVFTILVTISILIGGAVEFIPLVLVESNIPRIETVEPWSPLELAGRDLYIREGCNNCHSQQVRPFRHEIERYGEYSKPGETIYERPFLWGSKRTGPDLARVGGKYPNLWHVRHFDDPRSTSPRSIMPRYYWFQSRDLDFASIPGKLKTLQKLGVPYTDSEVDSAIDDAKRQAGQIAADVRDSGGPGDLEEKEIVAIVAYMQRLGADIKRSSASTAAAQVTPASQDTE
jgi:cbb3-type cytochrome c oxidase subunit II